MLRALGSFFIGRMERTWTYDASYVREVLAIDPWAFWRLGLVSSLGNGPGAPAEAMAAAGLAATLAEDCGPCTQIGLDMALKAGVPPAVMRAILAGDEEAMGPDAAVAWRFARASLARDLARADPLREEILARWGRRGLLALALRITTARMYPTLKYALGHGRACARVTVAGEAASLAHAAALAA